MFPRFWIVLGALSAAAAVALGAYYAHGLEPALVKQGISGDELQKQLHAFEVGVRYQMYHALGLILLGLLALQRQCKCLTAAGLLFVAGTILFSACLYVPVMLGVKIWSLYVPIGGAAYIAGWITLAISSTFWTKSSEANS